MTFKRKQLSYLLNLALIILTLGVSILGFLTYKNLNEITGKLHEETKPNTNFLLYKDIMLNISRLEDQVATYRLNKDESQLRTFDKTYKSTLKIIDSVRHLHLQDENQERLSDSLTHLFEKYYTVLGKLKQIERTHVQETLSDLKTGINNISDKKDSTATSDKKTLLKRIFSKKPQPPKYDLDSLENQMQTMLQTLEETAMNELEKEKNLELNYLSQINILQVKLLELLDYLEDREIMKSKINTLNAQELISKTKNQISIFSMLATALLIITLIILAIFTTRSQKYNTIMVRAKREAEGLAKSKEQFLANMSHEIRTPINAIIGFARQLSKSNLNANQKEQIDIIEKASTHLMSVLNDILDFTKLQNEKLQLDKEQFRIDQVLHAVVEILTIKAHERGNEIVLQLQDTAKTISGDPYRLKQILMNLIGNSIKFTENGKIYVSASTSDLGPKRFLLELEVKDTGIGIPKDNQTRIFEEFEQGKNSPSSKGTGLGLSIVKRIVDLHHGQISLKSEEGQGTEIAIMLPYDKVSDDKIITQNTPVQNGAYSFEDKKILIADDEVFNLKLLMAILEPISRSVVQASDGQQAMDLLKDEKFDIALLDIKMPFYSGWQIANETRNSKGLNQNTPLVALTATVAEEAQARGLRAGFNKLMRKPFAEDDLLQVMSSLVGTTKTPSQSKTGNNTDQSKFDISALKALGDETFVKDMLQTFVESSTHNIAEMEETWEKNQLDVVSDLAHKTVAPARHLGAKELVRLLKDVELTAGKGNKPDAETITQVKTIHQELIVTISAYLK